MSYNLLMDSHNLGVIVVEPVVGVRKIIVKMLKSIGINTIIESSTSADAWEFVRLKDIEINLIISEWHLPYGTGLDLYKRIKANSKYSKIVFLLISYDISDENILISKNEGLENFLLKPFDKEVLYKKINIILNYE